MKFSHRNTNTKAGKKIAVLYLTAAVGVSFEDIKLSERQFTILPKRLWKINVGAWNEAKL